MPHPSPSPKSHDHSLDVCQSVCTCSHLHVTTICNLLHQLPQKVNGQASRKICRLMLPAERMPSFIFESWLKKLPTWPKEFSNSFSKVEKWNSDPEDLTSMPAAC
uniref:Uncharacterized protein n=1 Tax=Micrurus lemniscatus lemniscatus TaxID=129467 RepID=A0A2D4HC70_MICLE